MIEANFKLKIILDNAYKKKKMFYVHTRFYIKTYVLYFAQPS